MISIWNLFFFFKSYLHLNCVRLQYRFAKSLDDSEHINVYTLQALMRIWMTCIYIYIQICFSLSWALKTVWSHTVFILNPWEGIGLGGWNIYVVPFLNMLGSKDWDELRAFETCVRTIYSKMNFCLLYLKSMRLSWSHHRIHIHSPVALSHVSSTETGRSLAFHRNLLSGNSRKRFQPTKKTSFSFGEDMMFRQTWRNEVQISWVKLFDITDRPYKIVPWSSARCKPLFCTNKPRRSW